MVAKEGDAIAITSCQVPEPNLLKKLILADLQRKGYGLEVGDRPFCFKVSCVSKRRISPLKEEATVEVVSVAPEDECDREMCRGDRLTIVSILPESTT